MLTSYCIRSEAWSGLFGSFCNIQNSAIETCLCCCPDLWTDETGCRRMPAQPTQPPKLCPPDKSCPPTSTLGHQIQPTIAHHNQIQPTSAPTRDFFINVLIQMHTNVREQTQHQMYEVTVLILEVRDQKDEQLLSEYWNFLQLLMVWGGVNHWKYVRQIFQMQFCIGTYNLPNL